jgi:hypothetical protein
MLRHFVNQLAKFKTICMLDNHYYYHDIPLKDNKVELPDCCNRPDPDDPGCSDCCYDEWKAELRTVNQRYTREKEAADLLQEQINFITDRRNRYKKWYDEIEYSEELSKIVCSHLEVIISQTNKIWINTCNANRAIKKLFCMVRDFFLEVDYLKCRYDELWTCITNSSDAALQEDKGIRTCLKNWGEKMDAVLKARDELLKLMVDAIRYSQLLRNNINTFCCPDKDTECKDFQKPTTEICENTSKTPPEKFAYGFKSILCRWYQVLGCDDCNKPAANTDQASHDNYNNSARSTQMEKADQKAVAAGPTYECCTLQPVFELPFCTDKYKGQVKKWLDADIADLNRLSVDISRANKNKEGLLACKTSLTKALDEADPKLRCK